MWKKWLQSTLRRTTGYELARPQDSTPAKEKPVYSINCSPRESFEVAKLEAGTGYSDPHLIAETQQKPSQPVYELALQSHLAALFASLAIAASQNPKRPLRVLDFGGSLGLYYHLAREAFEGRISLDWVVVETEIYARHAAMCGLTDPVVVSSIEGAEKRAFDFVLFSGVLQYLDDWRAPLNHPLVEAAPYILISRSPVGEIEIPFLQTVTTSTRRSAWPGRILRRDELSHVMSVSHQVALRFDYDQHLGEMGVCSAPSTLWKRR